MEQRIRLIAFDLDGTVLNSQKHLTERTRQALRQAAKAGIQIAAATGRTFSSLAPEILEMPEISMAITSNGAVVNRIPDGEIVYRDYLTPEAVRDIVGMIRSERVDTEVCLGGKAYIDQDYYERILRGESGRDVQYVKTTRHPISNIYDFMLEHQTEIENINLNFPSVEEKSRWQQRMRDYPNVTPTSSFLYNVELGGKHTSKASALRHLMKEMQLSREQVVAFGDGENDLEMIRVAGMGVAMANAEKEVRDAADIVADSNDQDGVAKVIEELLKGSV